MKWSGFRRVVVAVGVGVGLVSAGLAQGPEPMVQPQSSADEQARFLSGLRVPEGSLLAPLQREAAYLQHGTDYAQTWRRFHEQYFSPMRTWAAAEIAPRVGTPRVLYYLFAGPDYINAAALFPDAPVYVLGGLEPVGSMVPPERLDWGRLMTGLENLRESTSVTLRFSHFITKDMKVELERTEFKGVMPILMSFAALAGNQILRVEYIGIDGSGSVQPLASSAVPTGMTPGLRMVFRKNAAAVPQTLYYVQADLSNSAFRAEGALGRWMAGLGPGVSYLKAASYLMHEPYFSNVRNFLLTHSQAILQDDSGIPLQAFLDGRWRLTFFGRYSGTLGIFEKYVQRDLERAYRSEGEVRPLPFGTGYKWKLGESNLMLAVRQAAPPSAMPMGPVAPGPVGAGVPVPSSPPPVVPGQGNPAMPW